MADDPEAEALERAKLTRRLRKCIAEGCHIDGNCPRCSQ